MAKAKVYSAEFKQKVLKAYKEIGTINGAAKKFKVSNPTLKRWIGQVERPKKELVKQVIPIPTNATIIEQLERELSKVEKQRVLLEETIKMFKK